MMQLAPYVGPCPVYCIELVESLFGELLDRRLKRLGIDLPRWRVLAVCSHQPMSVKAISQTSTLRTAAASKIIQRMSQDGLVTSRTGDNDKRTAAVTITEKGEQYRALAAVEARHLYELAFNEVPDQEQRLLVMTLSKVSDALRRL